MDPDYAHGSDVEVIDLTIQLKINYSLKILKMFLVIVQGTYFLSAVWYIACD